MFIEVFLFEIKRGLKSTSTYIYSIILFTLPFLLMNIAGGAFDSMKIMMAGEKIFMNSSYMIHNVLSMIFYVGIIIVATTSGNAICKDYNQNSYPLFFTTSLSRGDYFWGRWLGSTVMNSIILIAPVLGIIAGSLMPWLDADKFMAFSINPYIGAYFTNTIPTVFIFSAFFFALSSISKKTLINWAGIIILFTISGIASTIGKDLDLETIAAIMEPFGIKAMSTTIKNWSIDNMNNQIVPFTGLILINKLVWLALAIGTLIVAYSKYSFKYYNTSETFNLRFRKNKKKQENPISKKDSLFNEVNLPISSKVFSNFYNLRHTLMLAKSEFKFITKNFIFIILLIAGLVLLFTSSTQLGKIYDTPVYPVTYYVIAFLTGVFNIFMVIITILFAGEMVWKERNAKFNEIIDATPIPGWVFPTSKLFSLMTLQFLLLVVVMICGIIIQTAKGYTNYEFGLYAKELFGLKMIDYWLLAVLAIFIQVLSSNKYIGFFITGIYYIFNSSYAAVLFKHKLLIFGSDPGFTYSDMNGFGNGIMPYLTFKIYWIAFALLLVILSNELWPRGRDSKLSLRIKVLKNNFSRRLIITSATAIGIFILSGGFIFYNTNILHEFQTPYQAEKQRVNMENELGRYKDIAQPKITDVKLDVDIFPYQGKMNMKGSYTLKNKTPEVIDSLHIMISEELKIAKLNVAQGAEKVYENRSFDYTIFKLNEPLIPGDSIQLDFDLSYSREGFGQSFNYLVSGAIDNGTFTNNSSMLPSIGYNDGVEIGNNSTRKKHGLARKERTNKVNDAKHLQRNLFIRDSDFITYEATISTSSDQIAITPGYLQEKWTENGRNYYHYKMDSKMLNFYPFLSAKYEVALDSCNPTGKPGDEVDIEIYYHKGHEYNIDRMINGIKKSLRYYATNLSPYQHKVIRIIEFPRYATFAQSFPNTIPFSEGIGFIADMRGIDDEDVDSEDLKIDYPFFVTAHEVAHQWFAHQVIGGNVEGSNMLSESLAQYASLMVMKKEYGEEDMKKFMKLEMNSYLSSRSIESEKEKPLALAAPSQSYLVYRKGAVVMYALQDYIGEDSVNSALQRYIKATAFQEAPYTNSLEFIDYIREVTPDSLQYIIDEWFLDMVVYSNKIKEASYERTEDLKYNVKVDFDCKKLVCDSLGKETQVSLNDWVEIGIYSSNGKELYLKKHLITKEENSIEVQLDRKPSKAYIDPYYNLINLNMYNNECSVEKI